jgi:ubiquitin C-terminal hydrolase
MSSSTIGFTGILNPANSCFMNAAVQCLSNARELRDYFLRKKIFLLLFKLIVFYSIDCSYLSEINRTNPLGMKGAMAEEFSNVIQNLWKGKYNYINANQLRVCLIQNLIIL